MSDIFEVQEITKSEGIVLSEEDFNKFVNRYELPTFRHEYTTEYKSEGRTAIWDNVSVSTVFQGVTVGMKTDTRPRTPGT
ncbi:MAG: hypothetical protein KAS66_04040 [Candidatus Omnitrophica bacterium]|nr:hypothetical protein [Candidatus Omnitrophota bacterium]